MLRLTKSPRSYPPWYTPTPNSFWRPSFPALESRLQPVGLQAGTLRILRFLWQVVTLPLWIALVLLDTVLPLPRTLVPRIPSWNFTQRLILPLLSRLIWAITFGLPPTWLLESREQRPVSKLLYMKGVCVIQEDVSVSGFDAWITGPARDPLGIVKPAPVPCFWFRPDGCEPFHTTENRVIMYLVGGWVTFSLHVRKPDLSISFLQRLRHWQVV